METTCSTCGGTGFEIRSHADGLTSATPCVCSQLQRGDRLLRQARIPRRYDHCSFGSYEDQDPSQTKACAIATEWVERWPLVDHGLLLLGRPGTGKTHLVVAMARELARTKGARVLFYEQRELLKELQATFDNANPRTESDVFRPIVGSDVLILDDLGAGRTTAWSRDVLHDVLVQRYNDKSPMLITSNHVPEDEETAERRDPAALTLRDRLGDGLMSRLYEMCRVVVVEGKDYRRGVLDATMRS